MDTSTTYAVASLATISSAVIGRVLWSKFVTVAAVPMNHRSVHSRNGVMIGVLEAGKYRFFGTGRQFHNFDTRLQQLTLQTQELTTVEGISIKVTAVGLYRVVDPVVALSATSDYTATLYTLVQLALRGAIAGVEAESVLASARSFGPQLLAAVREKASGLGLELTELVVRDIILPADIKAALSEQWRSKKSALAEIEAARGKAAAARTMANASRIYDSHPSLLKVRYIEAFEQAAKGAGNTFVIGMPDGNRLPSIQ